MSLQMERDDMERKIIRVSKKRQITIPLKFFETLNLADEVQCSLENDAIVIRPLHQSQDEFSLEILKDLISKGYSGEELIKEFEIQRDKIKKATYSMLEEADKIAEGTTPSTSFEELFGSED